MENGKRNLSPRTVDYLCDKCNINKQWLENGVGPMFKENLSFSFDEYAKEKGLSTDEIEIIKCYLKLDPVLRNKLIEHFKLYFMSKNP